MAAPEFDPSKPFEAMDVKSKAAAPVFDPNKPFETEGDIKKTSLKGASQAALEHMGNAVSGGYLPQAQAATEPIFTRIGDLITGQNVSEGLPSYVERRDQNIARINQERKDYPKSSLIGTGLGAVLGGAAIGSKLPITAATVGGRMLQGGAQAGLIGFASNPGDEEGKVAKGIQLAERLKHGGLAFPLGVAGQGLAEALTGAGSAGAKSAEEFAHEKALQAAGAMKKDFTQIFNRGRADELGSVLLDNKIVTPLATTSKIAERLESAQQAAGQEVGHILDTVDAQAAPRISAKDIALEISESPEVQALSKIPGQEKIANQVENHLNTLYKNGDNLTLREAQALRSGIDKSIKYNRKIPEMTGSQPILYAMRDAIARRMNQAVNAFDEAAGGTLETNRLKVANAAYSQLTTLEEMASNRVAGLAANRAIGLTDTIAGAGGANVGAVIGHSAGIPGGAKVGAVIGGAVGGAANKAGRTYGPSLMATTANSVLAPVARGAEKAGNFLTQEAMLPVYISGGTPVERRLSRKSKEGRKLGSE